MNVSRLTVGLIIKAVVLGVLWKSSKMVFTRLLDAADPEVVEQIPHAASLVSGVEDIVEVAEYHALMEELASLMG